MNWKGMMKNVGKASPLVLSLFGVAGVICTAVLSVKCTPKAQKLLEEKYQELDSDAQMSPMKKAVVIAPAYLPAIGAGAITIAAIVSSNLLSRKQNLSLAATCSLLQSNYKNYRGKVKDFFGKETDDKIQKEIAREQFDPAKVRKTTHRGMDEIYIWREENTGQYFEATEAEVLAAEMEVNRRLALDGCCSLADYCKLLKIAPPDGSENIGWDFQDFVENWEPDHYWVDFEHELVEPESSDEDIPPYYRLYSFITPEWDFTLDRRPDIRLYIDDEGSYAYDVR